MENKYIEKILARHPEFQYEEAKKEGHPDDEIIEYLLLLEEKAKDLQKNTEYSNSEYSIGDTIEGFGKSHPFTFWSLAIVIALLCIWISIIVIWKLIKAIFYQISYAISKGIKDGKN